MQALQGELAGLSASGMQDIEGVKASAGCTHSWAIVSAASCRGVCSVGAAQTKNIVSKRRGAPSGVIRTVARVFRLSTDPDFPATVT